MTLESCPRAAPRTAKAPGRAALAAIACVCLLASVSLDTGHCGGGVAWAVGDAQKARELFRQGSVFFDSGQFGKAIEVWQRAYEEKQDPGLLYNIGQAYRLAGDPRKALFFYRSFLRKTPRSAHEREEAAQKVAALEAQLAAEDQKKAAPSGAPAAPATATAVPPLPVSPPLTNAGASGGPTETAAAATPAAPSAPEPDLPPTGAPEVKDGRAGAPELQPARVTPQESSGPGGARDEMHEATDPLDFGLAPGVTTWLAGPSSGRRSAFAAAALVGYAFGNGDRDARVRFRLGALVQYATLHEPNGTDTFLDVLLAPALRIRAWDQRLFVTFDLGVGLLVLTGLRPSSDFLAHNQATTVTGTQTMFELRPGAAVAYRLYPAVELFAGPALAWNPKKPHFHEPMLRLQLLGGVALRF